MEVCCQGNVREYRREPKALKERRTRPLGRTLPWRFTFWDGNHRFSLARIRGDARWLQRPIPGRVSGSSQIGAGVYANDATCAVSRTDTGEHFIRGCVAHNVHAPMHYLKRDIPRAAQKSIGQGLQPLGGHGGVIAVSHDGKLRCPSTHPEYRTWVREGEAVRLRSRRLARCALIDSPN